MSNGVATLVSIPASNYVEKARWALQLTGIAFREEKWAPVFAYFSTKPKGGASVPLLVLPLSKSAVLTNSSDILDFCAQTKPDLYPNEDTKKLELYYDTELGPHTRCCGTFLAQLTYMVASYGSLWLCFQPTSSCSRTRQSPATSWLSLWDASNLSSRGSCSRYSRGC